MIFHQDSPTPAHAFHSQQRHFHSYPLPHLPSNPHPCKVADHNPFFWGPNFTGKQAGNPPRMHRYSVHVTDYLVITRSSISCLYLSPRFSLLFLMSQSFSRKSRSPLPRHTTLVFLLSDYCKAELDIYNECIFCHDPCFMHTSL